MTMALRRKKDETENTEPKRATGGRALLVYFLPMVVVALLLMLALAFLAQQAIQGAYRESAATTAKSVAEALARQLQGDVEARLALTRLVLADGRVAAALAGRDAQRLQQLSVALQRQLPGALQVRILARDLNEPDPGGAAPMGYAGLDMLRSTVQSSRPSKAEVHQIKSGAPYLALAQPISADGETIGALFVAWDLRPLAAVVADAPAFPGGLELVQGGSDGFVVAGGSGRLDGVAGTVDVPSSIWQVRYAGEPRSGGFADLGLAMALVGGGVIALLLIAILQWRSLARDLRTDMGVVVTLAEAILQRASPPGQQQPHVSSTADAIALLSQYAREARDGGPPAGAAPAAASGAAPIPASEPPERSTHGLDVEELDTDPAELLARGGFAGHSAAAQMEIPESLFRAYDIRGVVGEALTTAMAERLGQALGTLVQEQGGRQVAVAHDARVSSPSLVEALTQGLTGSGCDVLDIGQAPTPLLYFALHTQPVQAGVMVTGSHNPTAYNGFKIVVGERVLDGAELLQLRERMQEGVFNHGSGQVERIDLFGDYIDAVNREVQLARPLKVVVDAGNGVAGEMAIGVLESLGCEVVPLFCEPDGSFPNHHPDPGQPDNLSALMLEVQAQTADIGVAFDGDGDRLGVVDNAGRLIWPDRVLMLLASDILGRHPGVDILYDVKSSRHLASFVLSHGGRPIMWQSGHSRMRSKMQETGALLGGEFSGHLFIKERWYGFDDAIYATARVLEILALDSRSADALFAEIPDSPATPEYQMVLEEGQSADLMRALDAHKVFDDARLVELDGLRVEFADGWGLIRPSNTTPALTFRFEADSEGALEQIKSRFRELLRRAAPDMQAPF